MSSKFFNNIETPLIDKFRGIASNMSDFNTFLAVAGNFRSSGYFKLRRSSLRTRYNSYLACK